MIKGLILQRDFNVAKPLLLLKSGLLNCFVQGKLPLQNPSNEHHQKLVELKTTLRNSELHSQLLGDDQNTEERGRVTGISQGREKVGQAP